jgi:hypothetical protein
MDKIIKSCRMLQESITSSLLTMAMLTDVNDSVGGSVDLKLKEGVQIGF